MTDVQPRWSREQARSLRLHQQVAARLASDPDGVMRQAYENLDRLQAVQAGGVARSWIVQWRALLDRGPGAVLEVLTGRTERACELRQNSPFAGVL